MILFSTAFSVNDKGVLPLNFGPLNRGGGERRLNVAITRARRQVLVFSSFDPQQLRAESTSSVGIKHLRAYLDLAAQSADRAAGPDVSRRLPSIDRHRDDIADELRARGLVVTPDVGLSDFRIDLAVASPDAPDRPVVAVLLDGPGWAARGTVGDRDGLPGQVLQRMLRWPSVLRVWLPAWLDDPEPVLDQIERAVAVGGVPADLPTPAPRGPQDAPLGRPQVPDEEAMARRATSPEQVAPQRRIAPEPDVDDSPAFRPWVVVSRGGRDVLDRLAGAGSARGQVRAVLEEILAQEAPVHRKRLARLAAGAFELSRVSDARIAAVLAALPPTAVVDGDGFVWASRASKDGWSTYRPDPTGVRPIDDVSLEEIGAAMVALCTRSGGMLRDELRREALLVFGGHRLTSSIQGRLELALDRLLARGVLGKNVAGFLVSRSGS